LLEMGLAYPCACSRKDLPESGIYPGTCREGIPGDKEPRSVRVRVDNSVCDFTDSLQGYISESPASICGDFILHRADGLFAYQLAVVVDDHFQGVTQVVRGADLLDSTSRQIYLQKLMGFVTPSYMHLPVAISNDGKKLSKRTGSDPVNCTEPAIAIEQVLNFLGQDPPTGCTLETLWAWAFENWNSELVPHQKAILPAEQPDEPDRKTQGTASRR
jgi:glutamyl-Q tRNA(Asp) synthetase